MFLWNTKKLNYEDRPKGVEPYMLLLHYTGMESMEAAKERLSDPEGPVSAHYLIDEDGTVFDLVPEDKRAWHAGVSFWDHESDINSVSIGIEIVNPGHEFGYRPFPEVQMQAVLKLCQDIQGRYDITHVLGHSDVSPERKQDPGEIFEWQWLAEQGVGIWPDPTEEEEEKAKKLAINDFEVEKLFVAYGYNPMAAYVDTVTAFHRHYLPETFLAETEGVVHTKTVARLLSLIRQQGYINAEAID